MTQNTIQAPGVDYRAGRDAQRAYRDRRELNAGERAILSMLTDLSSSNGVATASVAYMAAALGVAVRTVQRMLNGITKRVAGELISVRPGLVERGYLIALPRRGHPTLYKLGSQPVENHAQGVTQMSPQPLTQVSPPGVTLMSPNVLESNRDSAQGVTREQPELWERTYFNVSRPLYAGDWMTFDKRICVAFNNWGLLTHLEHEGHDRKILACKRSSTALVLTISPLPDSHADASAQDLVIPFNRIVQTQFFRLRHARRRSLTPGRSTHGTP